MESPVSRLRDLKKGDSFRLLHPADGDPLFWKLMHIDARRRQGFICASADGRAARFYGSTEVALLTPDEEEALHG